ncbi:MAG: DsrE/DsrF/DrsH-like family protein [Planctomycetes bacterium]|nr:DsrE/DsrF/DrsH-like family protein [Planctomycetota bacterium]
MTATSTMPCECPAPTARAAKADATFILFSGDMDRALAAFTLANTAAAAGMKTTLFFTFWGITAVRGAKRKEPGGFMDRLFGAMLPRGAGKLPTSRMNFLGLGPRLFRWRMAKKRQPSLELLLDQARLLGVRLLACEASADMLGFGAGDLVEGVEIAGAMSCLRDAAASEVSLFI